MFHAEKLGVREQQLVTVQHHEWSRGLMLVCCHGDQAIACIEGKVHRSLLCNTPWSEHHGEPKAGGGSAYVAAQPQAVALAEPDIGAWQVAVWLHGPDIQDIQHILTLYMYRVQYTGYSIQGMLYM